MKIFSNVEDEKYKIKNENRMRIMEENYNREVVRLLIPYVRVCV